MSFLVASGLIWKTMTHKSAIGRVELSLFLGVSHFHE